MRASDINEEMKVAAAEALAALVGDQLSEDYIIPAAFDPRVGSCRGKGCGRGCTQERRGPYLNKHIPDFLKNQILLGGNHHVRKKGNL